MAPRRELASYARPPLTEVVLSVQFEPLPEFNVAVLGQVWSAFRDNFPQVKHLPPIAPEIERVGIAVATPSEPGFMSEYPAPRLWFLDAVGRELIQVQSDRFIRNWRKVSEDDAYPRYEKHTRPLFERDYKTFSDFLAKQGVGPIVPNQCEVTYLNIIPLEKTARPFGIPDQVLNVWNIKSMNADGLQFENAGCKISYTMEDAEGTFFGRLRVASDPAVRRSDGAPAISLNLTARGQPSEGSLRGVLDFFDRGRESVVNLFEAITSEKMQQQWGKNNVRR